MGMHLIEQSNSYMINDTEYFYNLDSPSYHPNQIKAYIPKLMPAIAQAPPKQTKFNLVSTIFCNSLQCKPTPANIVTSQNFVTLTRPFNLSPSYWQTSSGGRMIKNKKHILKVTNKDIRQMHFIEDQ